MAPAGERRRRELCKGEARGSIAAASYNDHKKIVWLLLDNGGDKRYYGDVRQVAVSSEGRGERINISQ